ncbi:MAG: hypothetical protein GXO98_07075 [Nitrospirae bacterium]|nr:hypothetical protein [Nitrospirota bacterium]
MTGKAKRKGKRKRKKKKNFFIWKYLILTILFFSIILFYVWERVARLEAGYRIKEKVKQRDRLIEKNELFLSEAVSLKAPQRLERIAREELGLIVPTEGESIRRIVVK